jgi:serine phosphatase RsbU (regulator of sigma subunit)
VAGQIRIHVSAALREAELQRALERMNHDLGIARSIQQGLLPRHPPDLAGFEIAGWNQPADQTGGDYFDWQALPDGRFAISLADVTGHGIGPALVMAACRAYARASFLAGGDPSTVLDRLNQLLAEDLPADRFVTFAVALLDPVESKLQLLSAGHGPILWYRPATGEIRNLDAQGIPLGLIPRLPGRGGDSKTAFNAHELLPGHGAKGRPDRSRSQTEGGILRRNHSWPLKIPQYLVGSPISGIIRGPPTFLFQPVNIRSKLLP